MDAIASQSISRITAASDVGVDHIPFAGQELANPSWAYAFLSLRNVPLLASLASQALLTSTELEPQSLALTAWSYAALNFRHNPLCSAIAAASRAKISQFGLQDIANLAWSLAVLEFASAGAPLLDAIWSSAITKLHAGGGGSPGA